MTLFSEAIKIKDGEIHDIIFHQARFEHTFQMNFGNRPTIQLKDHIVLDKKHHSGLWKCRICYGLQITSVEITQYQKRKIDTLRLVYDDEIDYRYKSVDRSAIDRLLLQKGSCDDIIIIKNGKVTDSSFSNIVFEKEGIFYTPISFLLPGTKRNKYIEAKSIIPTEIYERDIYNYQSIRLINAMIDLEESPVIPVTNVFEK